MEDRNAPRSYSRTLSQDEMKQPASVSPIFELHNVSHSSTRKVHIRRLNDILYVCLERGDLNRALRAWQILSTCKEFDWISKWKTGLHLLSYDSTRNITRSNPRSLEFLKKLMRHYPEQVRINLFLFPLPPLKLIDFYE